jgi:hypothetical protein
MGDMKHYLFALWAATLLAALTACGGSAQSAPASGTLSPTQSSVSRTVPDVTGAKFQEARGRDLSDFKVTIVGSDGKKWKTYYPDKTVVILSTDPAAGTVTDKADLEVRLDVTEEEMRKRDEEARAVAQEKIDAGNAALEEKNEADEAASKMANRYEFGCGGSWQPSGSAMVTYRSLKEVWASKYYSNADSCSFKINGVYASEHDALFPSEQAIVDMVTANGGGSSSVPSREFDTVMDLCVKLDRDYADKIVARMDWRKAEATAALALCPEAPHAAMLQEAVSIVKVSGSATYTVGKDMEPGTYQTKPSIKDCYWSRTTGGGDIIANNFVGFAPDGVTVTVYAGEGFESQRCGIWTKIG